MVLKILIGVITNLSSDKSLKVSVSQKRKIKKYGKFVINQRYYKVHDPYDLGKKGNIVAIRQCRPLSRTKRWKLLKIL
jgi:small subunit ribosomal protein S17